MFSWHFIVIYEIVMIILARGLYDHNPCGKEMRSHMIIANMIILNMVSIFMICLIYGLTMII
jgi:hypothetical protein